MLLALSIVLLILEIGLVAFAVLLTFLKRKILDKKTIIITIPVFFLVLFINLVGFVHSNSGFTALNFYTLVSATLKSYKFEAKPDLVAAALDNGVYEVVYITGIALASSSLILSIVGFFNVAIINGIHVSHRLHKTPDIVVGYSEDAIDYCRRNKNTILFVNSQIHKLSGDEKGKLFGLKIPFIYRSFKGSYFNRRLSLSKVINFVYLENTKDLHHLYAFLDTVKTNENRQMNFHILTDEESSFFISDQVTMRSQKNPYLSAYVLNKHELLARNFCVNQNFAYYLPKDFFDGVTLKKDKKITVNLIGCGKTGTAMLKALIINNQFVTKVNKKYACYQIEYNVYDKEEESVKNPVTCFFNSYKKFIKSKEVPSPEEPCIINVHKSNIKTEYSDIHFAENENEFTFTIICLNKTIDNCQIASSLSKKLNLDRNVIFYNVDYRNEVFTDNGKLVPFGFKSETLKHDIVVNNTLGLLADLSNKAYWELKYKGTNKKPESFHSLSLIKKMSNIYADLNIKFKLNLLGLDMVKDENVKGLTKAEYKKIYNLSSIKKYEDYFKESDVNALAFQEHLRWCAFYIMNGYTTLEPSKFTFDKENNDVNTKDEVNKKHGCLTTFYGLDIVHKKVQEILKENKVNRELFNDIETYRYDFSLLDNIYEFLDLAGYKLIEK